jgi:hypothetical protein
METTKIVQSDALQAELVSCYWVRSRTRPLAPSAGSNRVSTVGQIG